MIDFDSSSRHLRLAGRFFLILVLAGFLLACEKSTEAPAATMPQAAPPPPEVGVVKVTAQSVPLTRELVGRLASSRVAQVRARVAGILLEQVYTEGTDVTENEVLFQIDPAPLKTTLLAQQAALAKAEADAKNALDIARRYTDLNAKGLISRQDLDTAMANQRTTEAAVKIAEANLEAAKLDLSYATVRAPFSGRAGRTLVNEGALVGQGETTVLTTVEQIDPIYVNFSQSLAEVEQLQRMAGSSAVGNGSSSKTAVDVILPSGQLYAQKGSLDFTDLAVDPGTGAISLRAVIPNKQRRLLPGMFVKLRLTMGQMQGAYLVPQASVLRDGQGAYVLVVNGDNMVQQKRVELQTKTASEWVVTGELQDNDQVIVSGLQKVRPGAPARVAAANADMAGAKPAEGSSGKPQ